MEVGNRKPEKLIAGRIEKIAEPRIAAICEFTKHEISRPKADDAVTIHAAPSARAQNEPRIGTSRTNTAHSTMQAKLNSDSRIYGSCLPIRN